MSIDLTGTNASEIAGAVLRERRKAGSPAMGMILTFLVVTDEKGHADALRAAHTVSREHPARILGVISGSSRGKANLDAEVKIGDGGSGETVLLRMSGELAKHPESVVLPLLLPDSPVVVWWPAVPPEDPSADPIGALAQRRITDTAAVVRGRSKAMFTQATNYSPGNTDLSWTRLTSWRALLAAALDQYPARVTGGEVQAERVNPSADLLVAWLTSRLKVDVARTVTKGPGITSVSLSTGGGDITISRPDGISADFAIPNAPVRPVALKRRATSELLAEELRRLDADDIYEETVKTLCRLSERLTSGTTRKPTRSTSAAAAKTSTAKKSTGKRKAPKQAATSGSGS
ncbi:MAG: glucose-6-phosphate dehydrogenase assembly protein OpcA [Nocardioidaceae bacterium]|nr:glucose-6-phosphate dehydrogenase assembly protein OpcA [Nocardioidaceae bacterium]